MMVMRKMLVMVMRKMKMDRRILPITMLIMSHMSMRVMLMMMLVYIIFSSPSNHHQPTTQSPPYTAHQNIVVLVVGLIAYLIPDIPRKLERQMKHERMLIQRIVVETELRRAKGHGAEVLSDAEREDIRKMTDNIYKLVLCSLV